MYQSPNRPYQLGKMDDAVIEDEFAPNPEAQARMAAYAKQRRLNLGFFIVYVISLAIALGMAAVVILNCLLNGICQLF